MHLSAVNTSTTPLSSEISMELSRKSPTETPHAVCPGFQTEEERGVEEEPCAPNSYPKVELIQGWGLWQTI